MSNCNDSTMICNDLNHLSTNSSGEVHGTECLHSAWHIVNASHLFVPQLKQGWRCTGEILKSVTNFYSE